MPAAPAAVALAWDTAMREFGFAIVSGHGISEEQMNGVYDRAQDFFARPLNEKMKLCFGDMLSGQGYLPLGNETVGRARDSGSRPDLCESLSFSNTPGARANLWPDAPQFRATVEAYMRAAETLARGLIRLSAVALALPEDYFAPFFTAMTSDLRCVLYPNQAMPPEKGQLRYGPHTDFSGFTILRQDSAPGGLEVKTRDGWTPVRPMPGTLVINAGDLIQRWTNDVWVSNIHRVVNPPRDQASGTRRLSIVLFTGPQLGRPDRMPARPAARRAMRRLRRRRSCRAARRRYLWQSGAMKRLLMPLFCRCCCRWRQAPFAGGAPNETKVAALMDRLRADPPALRVFLNQMPKGGDLHNHLDGSVWAEDFLKWADQDGWCIDAVSHALSPPPCAKGQVEARGLINRDVKFYEATIDALSMRNFVPGTGTGETSGHDHTFAAFPRFAGAMAGHLGDALAATRAQAAADTVQYVEQIADPAGAFAPALLGSIGQFDAGDFDADLRQVEPQIPALVRQARAEYDAAEQQRCASKLRLRHAASPRLAAP